MDFDDYEAMVAETRIYPRWARVIYPSMKLASETGEFLEKTGKLIRDTDTFEDEEGNFKPYDASPSIESDDRAKELGDILWYITALALDMGYSLQDVAEMNYKKLLSRRERGMIKGSGDNR